MSEYHNHLFKASLRAEILSTLVVLGVDLAGYHLGSSLSEMLSAYEVITQGIPPSWTERLGRSIFEGGLGGPDWGEV